MTMSALQLVLTVVEEFGREFECDDLCNASEVTILFDGNDGITDLCLISIVAALESAASDEYGRRISLFDEMSISAREHPFRTVGDLADFLAQKIG
jgi:hypothetical protein